MPTAAQQGDRHVTREGTLGHLTTTLRDNVGGGTKGSTRGNHNVGSLVQPPVL